MCIIFFHVPKLSTTKYALIIAANRDEFFSRPAKLARRWSRRNLIAGEDITPGKEGVTWFGFNPSTGSAAALLNLRLLSNERLKNESLKSRGFFIRKFLENESVDSDLQALRQEVEANRYSPFNFIAFKASFQIDNTLKYSAHRIDNYAQVLSDTIEIENDKVQGFSNTLPDCEYQKVIFGRKEFDRVCKENEETVEVNELADSLLTFLMNKDSQFPDPNLRDRFDSKLFPDEKLKRVASVRVEIPDNDYGTRASTVLIVDRNGKFLFKERSFDTNPYTDTCITGIIGQETGNE